MTFVDRANDSFTVRAVSPCRLALDFKLVREKPEGAATKATKMWAVRYRWADRQSARAGSGGGEWTPVMAMCDPLCVVPARHYRAATTGNYDPFAVWARKADYSPMSPTAAW